MDEMEEKQRQKTETETNKKLRQNICVQSICCAKMNKKLPFEKRPLLS
jgi:hypothetical protein